MDSDSVLDGLLTDVDNPQAAQRQASLKELARRKNDRYLVFNPLDEDWTTYCDGIGFLIPNRNKDNGHGLGKAVVPLYVAELYRQHIIDHILTSESDTAIRLENERRACLGMPRMSQFVGGEELIFSQGLSTSNPEARKRILVIIWLGRVERYGLEAAGSSLSGQPKDDRPLDERLLSELQVQHLKPSASPPVAPSDDLATKDVFTLRKIAREKGLEVEKTAKKADLISKISQ